MPTSEITLLEMLDSFKATIDRSISSLDRASAALKTGELSPEQTANGLSSVQTGIVDLSHALYTLTAMMIFRGPGCNLCSATHTRSSS